MKESSQSCGHVLTRRRGKLDAEGVTKSSASPGRTTIALLFQLCQRCRNPGLLEQVNLPLRSGPDNNLAHFNIGRLLDCKRNRTSDRIR
jgi:hypothetical protein